MEDKAKELLTKFLEAWVEKDYAKMFDLTNKTWKANKSKDNVEMLLVDAIKAFKIGEIREYSPTVYDIDLKVVFKGKRKSLTARLICETSPHHTSVGGEFGVNPISLIRRLY